MPSPVAPRGAVENWYTRPAPPVARTVARATCAYLAGRFVERIDAPPPPRSGILRCVASGDEIDARAAGQHRHVGIGLGRPQQRFLHRPPGRIVDVDDAAVTVAALAGQVQRVAVHVERHAQIDQPRDRGRGVLDHEFDRL